MGTIRSSLEAWPLAITVATGFATVKTHEDHLREWDGWFARDTRFAVLRLFRDLRALDLDDGTARVTKRWLRDGASEAIRRQVVAMVNVVPEEVYPRMTKMSVERTFGVPGTILVSPSKGIDWIAANTDLAFDRAAAIAVLAQE